jgi:hypothetical protein
MELKIKSMPIGWAWDLKTDDGTIFGGVSLNFNTIFARANELNSKVIDVPSNRVNERQETFV